MMKTQLLFLLTLLPFLSFAQAPTDIVDIPDGHFLNDLILQGVDANGDGQIQMSEAQATTRLFLFHGQTPNERIDDLTGIEAFTNLTYLEVGANSIDSLDLSQNTLLDTLYTYGNTMSYLKIGSNPNLIYLDCSLNELMNLDVSQCSNLKYLDCSENLLEKVDIRNGNYENLSYFSIGCYYYNPDCNPNPTCIFVDNIPYFESHFPVDSTYHYVENEQQCADALAVEDFSLFRIDIYPNPVHNWLYIQGLETNAKIALYNLNGKQIIHSTINSPVANVELTSFDPGIYILKISVQNEFKTYKIIKL